MLKKIIITGLASTLFLSGCAENSQMQFDKETAGTLIGAGAGAWAGSSFGKGSGQIVATAIGTIAGGLIGNQLGQALDDNDRMRAERATRNALENGRSGQAVVWRNPDNAQTYGEVIPERSYTSQQGQNCREYTQKIYVDGQAKMGRGTACRDFDGTWQIQNG